MFRPSDVATVDHSPSEQAADAASRQRQSGGWFATLLVRPLTDKVPFVRAESRVIHGGGRMASADARLTGPDGRLYAHGSTTCFIFDNA